MTTSGTRTYLVVRDVFPDTLIRETAGTSVAGNNVAAPADDDAGDDAPPTKSKAGFSAFAALGLEEPAAEEEEEDYGGLMVCPQRLMCPTRF